MPRLPVDGFVLALLGTVLAASLLPAQGQGAVLAGHATTLAIGFLFLLYGARLAPEAALQGLRHWRLHGAVLLCTFALFPLLGLATAWLPAGLLPPQLQAGVMFLCLLPSTVQSSIAFTSIARGNVAAALCSATLSNILGIALTPLLVALLMHVEGVAVSWSTIRDILLQLLLPFAAGQALRPWIGGWVGRHKRVLGLADRGSILLVVYAAFSEGVVQGIWHRLAPAELAALLLVCALLLAAALAATTFAARRLGFARADEIVMVFCGSKKSLATGLPMASVIFPAASLGLVLLPLMLFHQMQLMACAWLARRYAGESAARADGAEDRRRLCPFPAIGKEALPPGPR
jgi:sodium/bile acid cotransporter 7